MNSISPEERLFGAIAIQLDFLSVDQLRSAINASSRSGESLQKSLIELGVLEIEDCEVVRQAVDRHIARHDHSTEASLTTHQIAGTLSLIESSNITHGREGQTLVDSTAANGISGDVNEGAGRYAKVSEHAQGGLGQVFIARDTQIGRDVALKEIKTPHAHNTALRQRFLLEAEVTGRLEHPGVVPIYGLGTYDDGRPYYAMRFIHGDSLRDAIDELHGRRSAVHQPTVSNSGETDETPASDLANRKVFAATANRIDQLALRKLLARFVGVCNAIGYAHSRGVLHRDIKPDNIMLGEYGETLVVDWGLAKILGDSSEDQPPSEAHAADNQGQTMAGSIIGTPAYMSPEQASGRNKSVSVASDIYSLGATLYAILAGCSPLSGSVADVLKRVSSGEIPPVRQINRAAPAALEAICTKAMAKEPGDRYATCSELANDIEAYLAGEAVAAWQEPISVRASRWVRKHRTLATSFVVGISVLTAASVVGMILLGSAYRAEQEAKDLADQRLRQGRRAVDQYLVSITDDPALTNAGFEPLRARLLNGAGDFYEVYSDKEATDQAMRYEQGWAKLKLAEINHETGKLGEAEKLFQQAADAFENLAQVNTENDDAREASAMALQNRAVVLQSMGRLQEAEAMLRKSTAQFKILAERMPRSIILKRSLADNVNIRGNWAFHREEYTEAGKLFQAEGEIRKAIIAESEVADPEDIVRLASVFSNSGHIAMQENRFADAQAAYEQGAVHYRDLISKSAEHRYASSYKKRYAESLRELGDVKQAMGDFPESVVLYEQAAGVLQPLVEKHPAIVEYQQDLAMVRNNLGANYVLTGDNEQGKASYNAAIEAMNRVIKQRPDSIRDRKILAGYLVNAASLYMSMQLAPDARAALLQAVELYEKIADDEPEVQSHRVQLATVHVELASIHHAAGEFAAGVEAVGKSHEILAGVDATGDIAFDIAETKGKGFHVLAMIHHTQANFKEAAANYDQAIELRRSNLKHAKESGDAKTAFAASLASRARVDVDAKSVSEQTIPLLTEALELLAAVRKEKPAAVLPLQFSLAGYDILASAYRQLGEYAKAKKALADAFAIAPADRKLGVQLLQLDLFGRIGEIDSLNNLADQVTSSAPAKDNPWLLAEVARPYGHAFAVVQGNEELTDEKRTNVSDMLAAKAIAILEEGEQAGGFLTLQNTVEALAGEGFDAIRERDEFKSFVQKYEGK